MVSTRSPGDDEGPRGPGEELLSSKALLLVIIAVGIAVWYAKDPRWGTAVLAAVTVLALLSGMIR